MSPLQQYAILLGLVVGTVALVGTLHLLARTFGRDRPETGNDLPFSPG
jgi:hypothetical protein